MPHKRQQDLLIPLLTVISDVVAIEASFLFSYWLRFFSALTQYIPISYGLPPLEAYIKSSLVVIPVWCWLFNTRHLYLPRRITSFSDEFFAIVRVVVPLIFIFTHCILDPRSFCSNVYLHRTIYSPEI
jgi:hypothetical protein